MEPDVHEIYKKYPDEITVPHPEKDFEFAFYF